MAVPMIDLMRISLKDIHRAIEELIEQGWRLPIYAVIVGSSGSLRYVTFRRTKAGFDSNLLALVDNINKAPDHRVNLVFMDSKGRICLAEKAAPEPEPWTYGGAVH